MSSRTSVTVIHRPTNRQEKACDFLTEFPVRRRFPEPEIWTEKENHDSPDSSLGCSTER
jgi:hypothetical protein